MLRIMKIIMICYQVQIFTFKLKYGAAKIFAVNDIPTKIRLIYGAGKHCVIHPIPVSFNSAISNKANLCFSGIIELAGWWHASRSNFVFMINTWIKKWINKKMFFFCSGLLQCQIEKFKQLNLHSILSLMETSSLDLINMTKKFYSYEP